MKKFRLRITADLGFEVWQDIPDYEGYYQVSTYGRVRTTERKVWNGRGYYTIEEKIKTLSPNRGYLQVKLSKDSTDKMFLVHRLVALTFLPNPYNYPCINHKDEKPINNNIDNLEWCTVAYNNAYNGRNERISRKMGRGVQQFKDGVFIKEYHSCKQAARELGIFQTHISECARGIRSSYGGYEWKYV